MLLTAGRPMHVRSSQTKEVDLSLILPHTYWQYTCVDRKAAQSDNAVQRKRAMPLNIHFD
jgi:hypothetical protein